MSIDKSIAELTAALDRNTAALLAAAGAGAAAAAAPAAEKAGKTEKAAKTEKKEEPKITQDQVNAALIKIKDDYGMEHAKEVIKEQGKCDRMADIKPAQYQAVYDAAVAKHAELSEAANGGGGGDL